MRLTRLFLLTFGLGIGLLIGSHVSAATLLALPETRIVDIGQSFSVDIVVDSQEESINAVQAVVRFSNTTLRLDSFDKAGSVFNFWVEEPTISNEAGTLRFIGGTARGVAGSALRIVRLNFTATGAGIADITLGEAAVIASDGKGTNVLSAVAGTSLTIGTKVIEPGPVLAPEPVVTQPAQPTAESEPTPAPAPAPEPIRLPERVEREPVVATTLPAAPVVEVPLYPDQNRWYNHLGEVIALWELPLDILAAASTIDSSPNSNPIEEEPELFTGKRFGVLEEGIWFVRTQFRNSKGKSPFSYYKISLDTTPPLPFDITIDNQVSDNPTPTISFETQDSLSGLFEAVIIVDNNEPTRLAAATSTAMTATLPILGPGQHTVRVKVYDQAGNSVEDDLQFEILPLPLPEVDFFTRRAAIDEAFYASGSAIPNGLVTITIFDRDGRAVYSNEIVTDDNGQWSTTLQEQLPRGSYEFSVTAHDQRGASSYPTERQAFSIKPRIIFSLGLLELGWLEIILITILSLIAIVAVAAWIYVDRQKTQDAYREIAGRDLKKLSNLLEAEINDADDWVNNSDNGLSERARIEVASHFSKMRETLNKMGKYVVKEISKLK